MTFPLAYFGHPLPPLPLSGGFRVVGYQAAKFDGGSGAVTFNLTGEATVPAEGDLVLVCTNVTANYQGANGSITTGGYTVATAADSNDTQDACTFSHWKIMGSTPDTTVTVGPSPFGDSQTAKNILIVVFRGADPTAPIESSISVDGGFANFIANGSAPVNPPNVTTVRNGAKVITFAGTTNFGELTTTGADLLFGINATGVGSASATAALAVYDRPTAGAFTTPAFTAVSAFGGGQDSGVAVSIVVRPPAP